MKFEEAIAEFRARQGTKDGVCYIGRISIGSYFAPISYKKDHGGRIYFDKDDSNKCIMVNKDHSYMFSYDDYIAEDWEIRKL